MPCNHMLDDGVDQQPVTDRLKGVFGEISLQMYFLAVFTELTVVIPRSRIPF